MTYSIASIEGGRGAGRSPCWRESGVVDSAAGARVLRLCCDLAPQNTGNRKKIASLLWSKKQMLTKMTLLLGIKVSSGLEI